MECKYCKKVLSTKSALKTHQNGAKYCLLIQGKNIKGHYQCSCKKSFFSKQRYESHKLSCNRLERKCAEHAKLQKEHIKLQKENARLLERNSILEEQLKHIQERYDKLATTAVKRPTTSTRTVQINNYIKNMEPLRLEDIQEAVPLLTLEQHSKGAEGYAEFALEFPFKNKIVCVDVARNKIKYKNDEGDVIEDIGFRKMMTKLCVSLKDRSFHLGLEHRQKLSERWTEKELDSYDFMEAAKAIAKYAHGRESEFCNKVIKLISKGARPA